MKEYSIGGGIRVGYFCLGKRLWFGRMIHIYKIFFQFWISKDDIPSDEEKEEEWETINPKSLHICPWCDTCFPKFRSKTTYFSYRLTPKDAIISYFPHNTGSQDENNKGSP
jgi:hypothetical protein